MKILKALGVVVLLLLLAVLVMTLVGARLPHAHTATASVELNAPPARVWQSITDTASQPGWRKGLKSVTPMPPQNGHPCWQETNSMGKMPMCEVAAAEPVLRVVRIADPSLPFGGDWVYQISPASPGVTRLTITENGTTGPALWRFVGHYIFHEDTQIKQYEQDLQQRLAQGS